MTSRPPNNVDYYKSLIKRLYNYEVTKMKELNGYDDRNYHLVTTDSKQFVLKITNKEESAETGLLDAVNSFMLHLYNNGFRVTVPQIDSNGKYVSFEAIPATGQDVTDTALDKHYGVRLLEYISGQLLRDVPFTPAILIECGQVLAKMTIALQTYDSPVLRRGRGSPWSLLQVLDVRQYLDAVQNLEDRAIVSAALDEFERTVIRRLDTFEHSFIHGDYNEMNIIVDKTSPDVDGQYHLRGVIDFSDVQYAPRVFDLAIYLCYSMLMFTAGPQILAPGFGLKGYTEFIKLTDNELNVLSTCIKARFCQSLVLGAHSYRTDPTHVYALSSAKNGWPALRALHNCHQNDLLNKWLNIDKHF